MPVMGKRSISDRIPRKATRIIQVIGEDKISIYAYLDNMLDYHFRNLAKRLPMISTKSINPFNNWSYGNSNCDMPADSHCLLLQDKIVIKKRSEQKPTKEKSIRTCPILWGSLSRKKPFSAKHCQ
jgi:hypothetical protein